MKMRLYNKNMVMGALSEKEKAGVEQASDPYLFVCSGQ